MLLLYPRAMKPNGSNRGVGAITSWMGWDVRGGASADPHAAEVFADSALPAPDEEDRYELIAVAARGFRPPRLLSVVHGVAERSYQGLSLSWSLRYRRVAETGPPVTGTYAIYLLGVNPPVDATETELDVFNDFYTNVHLPEVAERRHALRATRFELIEEIRPPYKGTPRFLAVYEVDEEAAANRRHVGPPYAVGPEVWQRHTTPWRLWYRLLVAENEASNA
jgi:hypothetical protein